MKRRELIPFSSHHTFFIWKLVKECKAKFVRIWSCKPAFSCRKKIPRSIYPKPFMIATTEKGDGLPSSRLNLEDIGRGRLGQLNCEGWPDKRHLLFWPCFLHGRIPARNRWKKLITELAKKCLVWTTGAGGGLLIQWAPIFGWKFRNRIISFASIFRHRYVQWSYSFQDGSNLASKG